MTLLQHHIFALTLTTITTASVGLLVFLVEPRRPLNQIFAFYSFTIAGWGIEEGLLVGAQSQAVANTISYWLGWVIVPFIGPSFLHTICLLLGEKTVGRSRTLLSAAYGVSASLVLLHLLVPRLLTPPPRPVDYVKFHHCVTPLGASFPLTFLVLIVVALWKLWQAHRAAEGGRRTQLRYLFWASVIGYLGGSPDWLFIFGFHLPLVSPFGIYGVPCYYIIIAYAVLQYQLFDVHLVIRKSFLYSILITTLTIGYFGLVYLLEHFFQVTFGYRSVWISLSAFALMALLFQPLKLGSQRIVDAVLLRTPREELLRRMERLEQETRHMEKLKAISILAAGMAHEIKNPLTSLKTFAQYFPEKANDPSFQQKFQKVLVVELDRIEQSVRQLLDFAKPALPKPHPVSVSRLLDETLDVFNSECLTRKVRVERSYGATSDIICADPQRLRQVFVNLLLNSFEAMEQGGTLSVATEEQDAHLTMTIGDTGKGIAEEDLSRLFEPFFTTKPTGTGLGLSIVRDIVIQHGGKISIDSLPSFGTCCTLTFPLVATDCLAVS